VRLLSGVEAAIVFDDVHDLVVALTLLHHTFQLLNRLGTIFVSEVCDCVHHVCRTAWHFHQFENSVVHRASFGFEETVELT